VADDLVHQHQVPPALLSVAQDRLDKRTK